MIIKLSQGEYFMISKYIRLGQTILMLVLALVLITAASCTATSGETVESKINWLYSWSEALSEAQVENKPIMIDFYTEWCSPCKQLDSDTFSDDDLGTFLNNNFVNLKSNAGESNLYINYSIDQVPTVVFTSPEGEEIGRMTGYRPPGQFYQDMQAILS